MIRSAKIDDAADLAILDNIASHGLSLWYWQQLAAQDLMGPDALEIGRHRMADKGSRFGFRNAVVAEVENRVAGAAVGFMQTEEEAMPAKNEISVFTPIFELFSLCDRSSWLIDSIAVYSRFRRQGIGRDLMRNCQERAVAANANKINLVAEDSNHEALALYHAHDFEIIEQRDCIPFNPRVRTRYWVLMEAPL